MSDSQKGASSSVDAKKKTPSQDEEIGKEFLSSWKSMSVTDDAMDFDFETVTQGKKKTFSFDKLDMDFNLDGGFDKISSFKVDMPDLDFSCQPKKTGKAKERSEDSTSGNLQPKQDHFAFSFDFNDDKLEKESRVIDSKFFKRFEELHQASSTCSNIVSRGGKSVGTTHLSSADERREEFNADDTPIGNKPVVRSHSTEITDEKHALLGNENSVNDLSSIRDRVCSDDAQNGSKLVGCSGPHDKDVTQGEPLLLGSEKVNVQKTSSAPVNCSGSTGQTIKSSTQKCVNPKLMVSSMASKRTLSISSLEGIKFSSLKAAKRTPDQSSLKSSRTVGLNKDLSSSTFHRRTKSLQKTEQDEQVQGHVAFRTASSVTPEKRTRPTLSLKRKTLEETNVDPVALNPPKRLSESPNESRKLKGASGGLIAEQCIK
ncbi:uncharacterized protein LOC131145167 isoform X6 [Malania oleifera]|uniref:uncharacterized protein LOC131145167 isoform X6 n=1 Tax=Malania oleifera TaxID=397392 RepID=UPI0025AEBBD9|nr:uncharacterized protein LOC131145167 isoform X6 [Malania oleifera]